MQQPRDMQLTVKLKNKEKKSRGQDHFANDGTMEKMQ